MFCPNCGKQISDESVFCTECGYRVSRTPDPFYQTPQPEQYYIQPGFSSRVNDPEILAMLKKNSKGTGIFTVILVLIPLIAGFIISIKNDDFKNLAYGGAVALVFLIVSLFSIARKNTSKPWDGYVVDKRTEERRRHDGRNSYARETYYITTFRTDRGETKKYEETMLHPYFDYLNIGDRVRFHPQFNCFYEKYDKTRDTYLYCPICMTANSITDDRCKKCGAPIIK